MSVSQCSAAAAVQWCRLSVAAASMAKAAVKAGVEGHGGCWMEAVSPSFCHEEPGGDEEEREHCGQNSQILSENYEVMFTF